MKWKYFYPKFEFVNKSKDETGGWAGHMNFAYDLISNLKPKVVVELGTHNGTSLFSMCQAIKDNSPSTKIFAVDTWKGDLHANYYDEAVYEGVNDIKNAYYSGINLFLLRKTFDEALSDFQDESIDILHIDGLHTYEAVKHDFETWVQKVKKDGIILFHDVNERREGFGVYRLWEQLKINFVSREFQHSHGLGILFRDAQKYRFPLDLKLDWGKHYSDMGEIAKVEFFLQKNNSLKNIEKKTKKKINNIVIYSAIFGDKDNILDPLYKNEDVDFICFTDNPKLASQNFDIKVVKPTYEDPTRNARMYKVLSHKFLADYQYSIWIDGNVILKTKNIKNMIDKYLSEHDLAVYMHPERNCIYQEANACIKLKKENPVILLKQAETYRKDGYPEKNGLVMTTVLLRRHSPKIAEINNCWWREISKHSKRDQMSFNYVAWKNNFTYNIIGENIYYNEYFERIPHKIKSSVSSFNEVIELKDAKINELTEIIKQKNREIAILRNMNMFKTFIYPLERLLARTRRINWSGKYYLELVKKAIDSFGKYGLRRSFVHCYKFVRYGRKYFRSREHQELKIATFKKIMKNRKSGIT